MVSLTQLQYWCGLVGTGSFSGRPLNFGNFLTKFRIRRESLRDDGMEVMFSEHLNPKHVYKV